MAEILCDADGILTDFHAAALKAHNRIPQEAAWPIGVWDMATVLGMSPDEFWEPLDNYDFWRNQVKLYDPAKEFFKEISKLGRVTIATTPSRSPQSTAAKMEMLRESLGESVHFMIGDRKDLMARPRNILIDDRDKNCDKFFKAGGHYILFPRPWNRTRHVTENDKQVYDEVRAALAALIRAVTEPKH